ncbi:MAG: carbohydrate-binding domain-containing protein, partial [Lachnospiraceae bacterium]|nr:carbohydrate-binding domain-containing protein [Lachnospiraceae bacterium]
DLTMFSGSLSVNNITDSSSANVNSIFCNHDLIMHGGSLWAENDHGYAVYADNNIEINGGQTYLKSSASGSATLLASKNIKFSGGNINIDSEEDIAVKTNYNIEIRDSQISIKAKKTGIDATGSFTMESGVLDIDSKEDQAIKAAGGVTLNTVEVTFPENGKVVGTTVTEEDGTTPAKQIQIKGTVSYPVWIGDTRITADNKDNIELVGGSATYDDITGTLTFTGDVTGINGAYELSGSNKAKIFSADMKGLTIIGNASIKDTEATVGIMSEGGKLRIEGNIEVYGSKSAVHTVKDLIIKGKLTAESADGFAVRSQNNIILEGEGLYAKNTSATAQAVLSDEKLIINSGIFEAESGFAAVEATGGIKAAEGFDITYPDHSRYSTDNKTIEAFDSELGYITAKKVRIEKRDRYGLYIGGLEVTSLNKDNVPGLKSGSASYNEVTKTLVFKGDDAEIDAFLGEYSAGIFSEDELNIEGNVRIDLSDKADHAIRTEGALTISGSVTANSDKYTVWAEDADLLVSGELKAGGEKAAVFADKFTVDGGIVSANVADGSSNAIEAKGDVELISGSITAINGGNYKANGMTAGGKVVIKDGNMLIIKTDKNGYGLRSGSAGITVEGGNLDIICKDSGNGIEESFLCIMGGTVNLETEAFSSNGYYSKDGNDINVFGGTLNVKSRLTPAVLCRKFVIGPGNVNINSGKKGINCALFTQNGGSVNIEAGDTAIDTEYFDIKSGKLNAVNTTGNGNAAIKSQTELELGEEIAIIEPEGGKKAQVVPESPDPAFYTIVDNGDIAADSVKLYAPSKYNVWVGATQVTDTNKADIEGVKGGKASYDPDSKTLIFTGDVTGVTGLDPEYKAQIYAKDQDLTISGNAVLTDDTSEFGIRVQGINLCINGDIQAYGKYAGIYASDNIVIDGNVTACGSFKEAAVDSYAGDIFLNSGKLMAQAAGADGLAAVIGDDIFLNSGEFTAVHEKKAALIANTCTIDKVTAEISGFKGIDVSHLTIDGGDVYVNAKDVAVSSAYEFNMNGGKLKAVTEGESAIMANGGITIAATHKISEPEGGKLSADGKTIVDAADVPAKSVTIEKDASIITDEENVWNLFTENEFSFEISALNAGTEVSNINKKSLNFYDAKLNGNTINVSLKTNADRKKAAKPANTILEFVLADGSAVTYVMPVQYVKPVFKLNVNTATINDGTETELRTRLLYKTKAGNFEPYDASAAEIKYGSQDAAGDNEGYISFTASSAGKGIKLSVKEEEWESAIELKFNVKAVKRDVLSIDLDGAKAVLLNTNSPTQKYTFDVKLNGKAIKAEDNVKASCKKAEGIAVINSENKLEIALPATAPKKGSYNVVLESGSGAKANVKVKVSDKSFDRAVVMKIQSKYDVVTGQKMVVVPIFKDAQTELIDVSSPTADITAELNDAGNIEIEYTGTALNEKNLKMGNIELKLELDGMADQSIILKNVKARKSTPKVKAGAVNLTTTATGEIKGSVNIISTYKDSSGKIHSIAPAEVSIVNKKKAEADVNADDKTEIDIKSMDAKSGSLKVQLTYQGGVTKKVTIRIKKK